MKMYNENLHACKWVLDKTADSRICNCRYSASTIFIQKGVEKPDLVAFSREFPNKRMESKNDYFSFPWVAYTVCGTA